MNCIAGGMSGYKMFFIDMIRPDRIKHRSVQSAGQIMAPAAAELFEEILGRGSSLRIRVTGSSMTSFINDGEFVIIRKVPGNLLKTGDIIFYRDHGNGYVLHRVLKKLKQCNGSNYFLTKGDALMGYDTRVPEGNILGRITRVEKLRSDRGTKVIDLRLYRWRMINHILAVIHRLRSAFYFKIYSRL
jgi:signal peptidase I